MQKGRFRDKMPSSDYLVFEEICPTWASKLRTSLDNKDVRTLVHVQNTVLSAKRGGIQEDKQDTT